MAKVYAFVSNKQDFREAVLAKSFNGPCDSNYSTPSIEVPPDASEYGLLRIIEEKYPDSKVFDSSVCPGSLHLHLYDEKGNEIA
jgi:hypothetical protein